MFLIEKKIKTIFLAALFFFFLPLFSLAQEENLPAIYLFYSKTCPHCAKEIEFLKSWKEQESGLKIIAYEVSQNQANSNLAVKVMEKLGGVASGVPLTVVGDKYIIGFHEAETTGNKIKSLVFDSMNRDDYRDIVAEILQGTEEIVIKPTEDGGNHGEEKISLPVFGEINPGDYSLFSLAFIIGGLDGFNPCASWALLFIIMLLIGMKDRFRMWVLGLSFLFASALTYFAFMTLWLNVMLLIGYSFIVRFVIGGTAFISGGVYLKKWKNDGKGEVCIIAKEEGKRKIITESLKEAVRSKNFWVAILGVIALGVLVNIFELFCSLGLPAVFTGYLASIKLSFWQYYFYLFVYIFAYMLDDMIIFAIAMKTLKISNITTKYSRYLYLIGGIALLVIGGWMLYGLF